MTLTDKERAHLEQLLRHRYDPDKYAKSWGGYEAALETFPAAAKPKAKKKTTKKKSAKK